MENNSNLNLKDWYIVKLGNYGMGRQKSFNLRSAKLCSIGPAERASPANVFIVFLVRLKIVCFILVSLQVYVRKCLKAQFTAHETISMTNSLTVY